MNLSANSNEYPSNRQPTPPDSIKKRLSLHVKRRLLEQATTSMQSPPLSSPQIAHALDIKSVQSMAHTMQLSPPMAPMVPKEPRKYKTHKKQQQPRPDSSPDSSGPKKRCAIARKPVSVIKRTKDVQQEESDVNDEDSGVLNAERASSDNEQSQPAAATATSGGMEPPGELKGPQHTPDILSMVLNEKKAALMNDPEVISFLQNINMKLIQQHHQQQMQRNTFHR